jgi:FkbM family methyltransferase
MEQASQQPADGALRRALWGALGAGGRVAGPRAARAVAALVLRAGSRTEAGHLRGLFRVARAGVTPPGLTRLPEGWWTSAPRVRARRLGLDLELDLRDNLQRTLYFTGTYEPALLRFLRGELRRGDVFVDVGAHVGVHSLTAAARLREVGGGTVIAFEPAGDSATALRSAAAANRLRVTVVELALGAAPGRAGLFADPRYDLADAGVRSLHGGGALVQSVPVAAFDDWAEEAGLDRLDLVKLDVEGGELEALRGMRRSLRRWRPRALVVEAKEPVMARAGVAPDDLLGLLSDCGYRASGQAFQHNGVFRPADGHGGGRGRIGA